MPRFTPALSADCAAQSPGPLWPQARVWVTLAGLYVAQAIPLYLIAAALPPVLRSRGVDLSLIGGLGVLMLPWVLKPLWAPWIDRLSRHRRIGRKGIILATQLVVVSMIAALSQLDPVTDIGLFSPCF